MDNQDLNAYIKQVVEFSFEANKYFNDSEPWALKKSDPQRMNTILFTIVEQIKNISILLTPIIPIATKKTLDIMNISNNEINLNSITKNDILKHDIELKETSILFNKIENDN